MLPTLSSTVMHMWNESLASRGSHEVGSCVISHLKEIDSDATNLILYSDACGGAESEHLLSMLVATCCS